MLTPHQKAHFETFGYLLVRHLFTPSEMSSIAREFDAIMDADKEGRDPPTAQCGFHDVPCLEHMHSVYGFVEKPSLQWIAEDDRIYLTLQGLLGPGIAWMGSEGQRYMGETNWHPDGRHADVRRIKTAIYLDPLTDDTGCLRVIPGSHRNPLHDAMQPLRDPASSPFGVGSADVPSHPIETQPGDVLFFNMGLWHATFGGAKGRRQIAIVVSEHISTQVHLDFLSRGHEVTLKIMTGHQYDFRDGRMHEDSFLHSSRPRIKSMVSKLVELGYR